MNRMDFSNARDSNTATCMADNGSKIDRFCPVILDENDLVFLVTRGFLPRAILIPLSSGDRSGHLSHTPPTPLRHDITQPIRGSLPIPQTNLAFNSDPTRHDIVRPILMRANTEPQPRLVNTSYHYQQDEKENERIYSNQLAFEQAPDSHQYASIDLDESNEDERVRDQFVTSFSLSFRSLDLHGNV